MKDEGRHSRWGNRAAWETESICETTRDGEPAESDVARLWCVRSESLLFPVTSSHKLGVGKEEGGHAARNWTLDCQVASPRAQLWDALQCSTAQWSTALREL